jgi:hypothetical protein
MATTKYIVDNVTGQTITGDLTINGNFTITGTTNTRPYKVYTALLTQSGGTEVLSISSVELVIGATYEIVDNFQRDYVCDFTNVGAPNNDIGTYFVATGTVPSNWGNGRLQYNTGAPVATVLENTIGNIWWTYEAVGEYNANSTTLFGDKAVGFLGSNFRTMGTESGAVMISNGNSEIVNVQTYSEGTESDTLLFDTFIEIRVYN